MKANPFDTSASVTQSKTHNREDCGCSKGLCPGVILAALFLGGWAVYSLAAWLWQLVPL